MVVRRDYARIQSSRDKDILPQGEVGGGLWVEISISKVIPVLIDCRQTREKSKLNLECVIARFRGIVCTMKSRDRACGKVVVADRWWLTIGGFECEVRNEV